MRSVDVLVVGAGSAGTVLAIELARRGVDHAIIEQASQPFAGSRGKGLQPRTLEIFDQMGLGPAIEAASAPYPPIRAHAADGTSTLVVEPRDPQRPGEPHPVSRMIPQWRTEQLLRERLQALGGTIEHGTALVGLEQDDAGVVATVRHARGEEQVRASWLVGTDGGRSTVRKLLGIGFPGETRPFRMIVADLPVANLSRDAWHRWKDAPGGQFALCPLAGTDSFQLSAELRGDDTPDLSTPALHRLVAERTGRDDLRPGEASWTSLYRVNLRLADGYRRGRALIAGDAAHVHPPTGGQGLNTSVQDAYNLGWKLAAVLGGAPDVLLDTYEVERRGIAAGVLTMSAGLLEAMTGRGDMRRGRDTLQIDLDYRASPLSREARAAPGRVRAGDRLPDAHVIDRAGVIRRMMEVLADPRLTLVDCDAGFDPDIAAEHGLRLIAIGDGAAFRDVSGEGRANWDLRGPTLLLVRPDGYLAAAFDGADASGVRDWLAAWLAPAMATA